MWRPTKNLFRRLIWFYTLMFCFFLLAVITMPLFYDVLTPEFVEMAFFYVFLAEFFMWFSLAVAIALVVVRKIDVERGCYLWVP